MKPKLKEIIPNRTQIVYQPSPIQKRDCIQVCCISKIFSRLKSKVVENLETKISPIKARQSLIKLNFFKFWFQQTFQTQVCAKASCYPIITKHFYTVSGLSSENLFPRILKRKVFAFHPIESQPQISKRNKGTQKGKVKYFFTDITSKNHTVLI